jgi:FkbM family methyltransferase
MGFKQLENLVLGQIANWLPPAIRVRLHYEYSKYRGTLSDELVRFRHYIFERNTKGCIAIDIGANVGMWSLALSRYFSRIEAFEPNPKCISCLKKSHLKNVFPHNVALSSSKGTYKLNIPIFHGRIIDEQATLNNIAVPHTTNDVPVHILDEYSYKDVGFIKIDVEGYELEVLKGAKNTITREKPIMVIEIEQRHISFPMNRVFEYVFSLGYEAFFINDGKLTRFSEFSYQRHQEPFLKQLSNGHTKGYINNFIFKPIRKSD